MYTRCILSSEYGSIEFKMTIDSKFNFSYFQFLSQLQIIDLLKINLVENYWNHIIFVELFNIFK